MTALFREGGSLVFVTDFTGGLGSGWIQGGQGWSYAAYVDAYGVSQEVARSNPCAISAYASISRSVFLSTPGRVRFRARLSVPDKENGLPGDSRLEFQVDGVEVARWAGNHPLGAAGGAFFLPAGSHTLTFVYREFTSPGAFAELDNLEVEEFVPVESVYRLTGYRPPRPLAETREVDTLAGPKRLQAGPEAGWTVELQAVCIGYANFAEVMQNLGKTHIFVDEGGTVWGGLFLPQDAETEKQGQVYRVRLTMRCPGRWA